MNTKIYGTAYIISAASGTGKTTLTNSLVKEIENLCISVSHTTRPMRPGEVDGINYHFISKSKFDEMLEAGEFIENAEVFGYSYGTSKQALKFLLKQGKDVILEIDWQGASQIRALFNNTVSIFIVPPSLQDLRKRLLNRNQDDLRTIDTRLNAAKNEIKHFFQYDYVIVNDNFDCALKDLMAIIRANRCRLETQSVVLEKLIQQLMN